MMKRLASGILWIALVGCTSQPAEPLANSEEPKPVDVQQRIQSALSQINDFPEPNHYDYTRSVWELVDIGEPAVDPTLPYLLSDNPDTRLRAATAIYVLIAKIHGFVPGLGWPDGEGELECKRILQHLYAGVSERLEESGVPPVS